MTLIPFQDVRRENPVLGNSTRTLRANCAKHGIPVVAVNKRVLALTREGYDTLLARVTGTEAVR